MSGPSKQSAGIAKLNSMYGSEPKAANYKWNGSDVVLKGNAFDEQSYLSSKWELMKNCKSELPLELRQEILVKIAEDNHALLFEMNAAAGPDFERLNSRFDFLLQSTLSNVENEFNVRKSREKITNSRSDEGWMSVGEVDALVRLNRIVKKPPTDKRKFVPKDRR